MLYGADSRNIADKDAFGGLDLRAAFMDFTEDIFSASEWDPTLSQFRIMSGRYSLPTTLCSLQA